MLGTIRMTISSTTYRPGNIVKVRIKFTAGNETKRRPAVILTNDTYHVSRADAIVVALSSQVEETFFGDYVISDWQDAGLPVPSKAKGVIATIDRATIEGIYGKLSNHDFRQLKICMRSVLGLEDIK
jgi:mRNA interferase MazF